MALMMGQSELARLAWLQLRGVGPKTVLAAFMHMGAEDESVPAEVTLRSCAPDRPQQEVRTALDTALRLLEQSAHAGIQIIPYSNPLYPGPLKELRDPPPFLFAKGAIPNTWANAVAVVGTREPSDYAVRMTQRLVDALAIEPKTIVVSGLAIGMDSVAHVRSIERRLCTVAVLANGLDTVYPKSNAQLAQRIVAEGGCLLSETPTGLGVSKYNLVARDRLQSGLARATFAMQTSITGGTMHTAQSTLEQRRTLVTLKPPVDDSSWSGNAFLLGQVREEWLAERPNLQKFLRLPRPWAYALTESRLEEFVQAAIASGFVPKGTSGKEHGDVAASRSAASRAPVSLFDAMNLPQHRLLSLVDQLRALLPELVRAAEYDDFAELPRDLYPPELGLAQVAVAFRASSRHVKMMLHAPFNVRDNDPTALIMGDSLFIVLSDLENQEINAGESVTLDMGPEILPDHVPRICIASDAFVGAVRRAEAVLAQRRAEAVRHDLGGAPVDDPRDYSERHEAEKMLRFTGRPLAQQDSFRISYRPVNQDPELVEAFVSAIKALAQAAGMARARPNDEGSEGRKAAREALLAYAILAVGEARAFILLLSDGLDKHARIHMRAIYDYEFRVRTLLTNDELAPKFMRSFAYEARSIGRDLGAEPEVIEAEIERALGLHPDNIAAQKESAALFGGTLRQAMDEDTSSSKRYAIAVRWASQVAHGTIVALRELEKSLAGADGDLFERAARAPDSQPLLYALIWPLLHLAVLLQREFRVDAEPEVNKAIAEAESANVRLGFDTNDAFVTGLGEIGILPR